MLEKEIDWDLMSSYAGLLALAATSIYAGSYGSLKLKKEKKRKRVVKGLTGIPTVVGESDDEEEETLPDRISSADAYLFPVLGSVVLFGLYLIVKYLGKEWINRILSGYFAVAGIFSVWKCLISLTRLVIGKAAFRSFKNLEFLILQDVRELVSLKTRTISLFLLPVALAPPLLFYLLPGKRSALLTDILALCFAHNAMAIIKIDSFQTGTILLSGLFLYDIWWVFGTDVMLEVATSLDAPVKLLWPKSMAFVASNGFSLLGLGDVVVPGLFVSLALRYDYSRSDSKDTSFSKPYFGAALAAYVVGLVTTMCVMHVFQAAQPALLYLSPACILSFVLTALMRGEFSTAWSWKDAPEEKAKTDANCVNKAQSGGQRKTD